MLASDDIYGQTFVDWFAFQAVELDFELVCIVTYKNASELEDCLKRIVDSGAEAIAALLNGKSTSQGGWTDGMIASYYQGIMAGKDTSRILGVQR